MRGNRSWKSSLSHHGELAELSFFSQFNGFRVFSGLHAIGIPQSWCVLMDIFSYHARRFIFIQYVLPVSHMSINRIQRFNRYSLYMLHTFSVAWIRDESGYTACACVSMSITSTMLRHLMFETKSPRSLSLRRSQLGDPMVGKLLHFWWVIYSRPELDLPWLSRIFRGGYHRRPELARPRKWTTYQAAGSCW